MMWDLAGTSESFPEDTIRSGREASKDGRVGHAKHTRIWVFLFADRTAIPQLNLFSRDKS